MPLSPSTSRTCSCPGHCAQHQQQPAGQPHYGDGRGGEDRVRLALLHTPPKARP
jgi:hypothetical protein